jgi:hypothetical protein
MRYQNQLRHRELLLAALVTAMTGLSSYADNAITVGGSPAVLDIGSAPPLPAGERRGLIITVLGFEPPASGAVGGVVALRDDLAPAIEVGRFSLYPGTAFEAQSADQAQHFQFDITSVVPTSGGGRWSAEIRLEPLRQDQSTAGALMRFGPARLFPMR